MMRFALRMLWTQRKRYYSIFVEQVLIMIALMISSVSLAIALEKYFRPGLLDVSNQYIAMVQPDETFVGDAKELFQKVGRTTTELMLRMKEKPYVLSVSQSEFLLPYIQDNPYYSDSIEIYEKKYYSRIKYVDNEGFNQFNMKLIAGEWFGNGDALSDGSCPILITQQLADAINAEHTIESVDELLGKKMTIGMLTGNFQKVWKEGTVVGIIAGAKEGTFESSPQAIILPMKYLSDSSIKRYAIKIKSGYEKEFYDDCEKELQILGGGAYELTIDNMNSLQKLDRFDEMLSLTSQATPTLFFIVFAFLGTFGLFWMQSKKKAKEYALQIAIGLAPQQLVSNIVLESVLLSLFASIPALIVAFFIYDWTWLHVVAIGSTILIMILFAVFSAWYPAYKVSRINPAEVLHYE